MAVSKEELLLILRLQDEASRHARTAADAIREVQQQAALAQPAVAGTGVAVSTAAAASARATPILTGYAAATAQGTAAHVAGASAQNAATVATGRLTGALNLATAAAGRMATGITVAATKSVAALGSIAAAARSLRVPLLALAAGGVALLAVTASAASDQNESISKATQVFGEHVALIEEFAATSADAFGISKTQANEYAATLAVILQGSKVARDASAEMSIALVKLAADLASFNNIPIDEALNKLRAGLVGEAEPLRTVGVLLSEAAVKAKAMELGMEAVNGKLTDAQKVQLRYAIILEQTTTAQGDFALTAEMAANQQRRQAAQAADLSAIMGEKLLPVQIALFGQLLTGMNAFSDWFRENEADVTNTVNTISNALSAFWSNFAAGATTVLPYVVELFNFIKGNEALVVASLVAIGVAMLLVFGPVGTVVVAITGLIAAIGYLRENWDSVWGAIQEGTEKAASFIGDKLGFLQNNPIVSLVTTLYSFRDVFLDVLLAIGGGVERFVVFVAGQLDGLIDRFGDLLEGLRDAAGLTFIPEGQIFEGGAGVAGGAESAFATMKAAVASLKTAATSVVGAVAGAVSRLAAIGGGDRGTGAGTAELGFENAMDQMELAALAVASVGNAAEETATKAVAATTTLTDVEKAWASISDTFRQELAQTYLTEGRSGAAALRIEQLFETMPLVRERAQELVDVLGLEMPEAISIAFNHIRSEQAASAAAVTAADEAVAAVRLGIAEAFLVEQANVYARGGAEALAVVERDQLIIAERIEVLAAELVQVFGIDLPEALSQAASIVSQQVAEEAQTALDAAAADEAAAAVRLGIAEAFLVEQANVYARGGAEALAVVERDQLIIAERIEVLAAELVQVFGIDLPEALSQAASIVSQQVAEEAQTALDEARAALAIEAEQDRADAAADAERQRRADEVRRRLNRIQEQFRSEQVQAYLTGGSETARVVKEQQDEMYRDAQELAAQLRKTFGLDLPTSIETAMAHLRDAAQLLEDQARAAEEAIARIQGDFLADQVDAFLRGADPSSLGREQDALFAQAQQLAAQLQARFDIDFPTAIQRAVEHLQEVRAGVQRFEEGGHDATIINGEETRRLRTQVSDPGGGTQVLISVPITVQGSIIATEDVREVAITGVKEALQGGGYHGLIS